MSNVFAFDLRTPTDLLNKIDREVERLGASSMTSSPDYQYQGDHAVNAAISMWHMLDWLWRSHEERNPSASVRFGHADFRSFHSAIRRDCGELDQCYNIATGAKHVVLTQTKSPAVSNTQVRRSGGRGIFGGVAGGLIGPIVGSVVGEGRRELVITAPDGTQRNAFEVMNAALKFWKLFFATHRAEI